MAEQYVPNLGKEPEINAYRDAIHIAVAPIIAAENLLVGARVMLDDDGMGINETRGEAIGIVDPFRTTPVKEGERFWLCLFPGTITGLRHAWSHPKFRVKAVSLGKP